MDVKFGHFNQIHLHQCSQGFQNLQYPHGPFDHLHWILLISSWGLVPANFAASCLHGSSLEWLSCSGHWKCCYWGHLQQRKLLLDLQHRISRRSQELDDLHFDHSRVISRLVDAVADCSHFAPADRCWRRTWTCYFCRLRIVLVTGGDLGSLTD